MSSKELRVWADSQQYEAAPMPEGTGPKVTLLNATPDPLGTLAAICGIYEGKVTRGLSEVTNEQRLAALEAMMKTELSGPLESISFVFLLERVDRAFTHQAVRGRNAFYAQESLRFAVKEDWAGDIPLPPSLSQLKDDDPRVRVWRKAHNAIEDAYASLVDGGIPAEEARGLLPHSVLTRYYWVTSLRELLHVAGLRLCTQAQFSWRAVMGEVAKALRDYESGWDPSYITNESDDWQFAHLADMLRPVCYQQGKCGFMAKFDRNCSIRDRVNKNERVGRPSSEWDTPHEIFRAVGDHREMLLTDTIPAIDPREWLADPGAARA